MSTLKTNNIQHVDRSDPSIIINTDGSVNIAGTMTYEDVTSVDAVGIITGREIINAQKQVHVGTGVSVKAGGINVTAGITTVQALQATSGTFSGQMQSASAVVTGGITATGGNIILGDSSDGSSDDVLKFGASADLSIYHNGSNSFIKDSGTGQLRLLSNQFLIQNAAGNANQIICTESGAVDLHHNGTKMLETTADGATVQKGLTVRGVEGGEAQIRIEADEADNASDRFRLVASDSAGFNIQSYDGSQYDNLFSGYINGTVELYHNNVKRLDTISTGIRIHGDEGGTAQLHFLADEGDDNADYWRIIGETSGPILNFQSYNSGNWTNNVRLTGDQGVELYWNNGVKLATSNAGIDVTGRVTTDDLTVQKASGNLSVMVTADNGLGTMEIGGSTGAFIDLKMPTSDDYDFRLGTSGTGAYILVADTGALSIQGHPTPAANNTYDLGTASVRWRNLYTNDLNLSNQGSINSIDNTWGDYTIQEGESDLFLINNRSGKKFKFMLQEVS